jgi:hypothetical protein
MDFQNAVTRLDIFERRMSTVLLEFLDFREVISRFDSKDSLFFVDPPYYGKEKYYLGVSCYLKPESPIHIMMALLPQLVGRENATVMNGCSTRKRGCLKSKSAHSIYNSPNSKKREI